MMERLGYAGMAIGLVVDSFGIPIPSEVLLAVGGALAATGQFELWIVFVLGVSAQLVGGLIGYAIGRYGGLPFLEKYGKYVFISKKDLNKTHDAFVKYGIWMTMAGRCIPVIRGLIAYPAGIARMRLDTFIIFTTLGSAVWTALFVWLGYTLGENLGVIDDYLHELSILIVVVMVVAIIWHFRSHLKKLKRKPVRRVKPGNEEE
jgi:membrane protein DedA with SNARE-associated domain